SQALARARRRLGHQAFRRRLAEGRLKMEALREQIDLAKAFGGLEIMVTGVTGFLGKIALTMLLDRYPGIGKVHVLVRPRAGGTAEDRFFGRVVDTPPFRPLRERHGDRFEEFLREKCRPIAGDVSEAFLGIPAAD